jgi:hypothetical protein
MDKKFCALLHFAVEMDHGGGLQDDSSFQCIH